MKIAYTGPLSLNILKAHLGVDMSVPESRLKYAHGARLVVGPIPRIEGVRIVIGNQHARAQQHAAKIPRDHADYVRHVLPLEHVEHRLPRRSPTASSRSAGSPMFAMGPPCCGLTDRNGSPVTTL